MEARDVATGFVERESGHASPARGGRHEQHAVRTRIGGRLASSPEHEDPHEIIKAGSPCGSSCGWPRGQPCGRRWRPTRPEDWLPRRPDERPLRLRSAHVSPAFRRAADIIDELMELGPTVEDPMPLVL